MKNEDLKLFRILAVLILSAVAFLSVATFRFFRDQRHNLCKRAAEELEAIGTLKAVEIAQWRTERLADARVLVEGPFLQQAIAAYLAAPSPERAAPVLARFTSIKTHYLYDELLLVGSDGRPMLSTAGDSDLPGPSADDMKQILAEREPVIKDVHVHAPGRDAHLGVIVPVPHPGDPDRPPVCAIVLVCNVSSYLLPLVETWPTPSRMAETLLLRREGDRILSLNTLRYWPDPSTASSARVSDAVVLAVAAALDQQIKAHYRGDDVLAYVCPVPDSPWFILAKRNAAEIFAAGHAQALTVVVLFFALVFSLVALGAALVNRDRKHRYRQLYESEARLRESLEEHRITLKAIGDAVIATDREGHVQFLNPVAEALTGWTSAQAQGRPLQEVFHIVNEQTRQEVESPVAKALREGGVVGLANHTVLIAKDGVEHPIADSAAPILDDAGRITGVVLVFRDQTLEHNYKTLFRQMLSGFASHELICDAAGKPVDYRFVDVNPAFERMTGLKARDVAGRTVLEVLPQTEPEWIERYGRVVQTGEPIRFQSYSRALDRHYDVTAYRVAAGHFATIFVDVTETKRIQEALAASESRYRSLTDDVLDNSEVGTFILDAQFRVAWVNKAMARYFGFDREAAIGADKRQLVRERIAGIFEDPQTFADKVLATYDDNTFIERFNCHVLAGEGREDRWLQHSSRPITTGIFAGGRVEHYYDITPLKRAEERLLRQNDELRRFNQLATGREARMVELKQEVNELARKLGAAPPYPLHFLADPKTPPS